MARTVRVLQSLLLPGMESGDELRFVTKDFGRDAASLAFFLLSRSCYARRPSVVVLQDRTVGTMKVLKQT
jgi:hypothetical protein